MRFNKLYIISMGLVLLTSLNTFAQNEDNRKMYKPWTFNINAGQTLFWGDVSDEISNPFNAYFNPETSAWAYGLIVQKNFNAWLGTDLQYRGGKLHGTRMLWSNKDTAGLYFDTKINDISLNVDIDVFDLFLEKKPYRLFNFYLRGGVTYNFFNANEYDYFTGQLRANVSDKALQYQGGWGVRFDVSEALGFTFENTFTYSTNDLLDAHSTLYSQASDIFAYTSLGASYRYYPKPRKPRFKAEEDIEPQDTALASADSTESKPELSISVSMPASAHINDTVRVRLTINKYDLNEKARIQQTLPQGFRALEGESGLASFDFSNNILSYNWEHFPGHKERLVLSYSLLVSDREGQYALPGIIFYNEKGQENIKQFKASIQVMNPVALAQQDDRQPAEEPVDIVSTQPVQAPVGAPADLEYRVQVKAIYGGKSSSGAIARHYAIDKEVNEEIIGRYAKYTAGHFSSYREAKAYKEELRAGRVPDAFVVAYYKGKRVKNIKDALKMEGSTGMTSVSTLKAITQKGVSYSVQVAASTRNLSATALAKQLNLEEKLIKTTHRDLYKYLIGSFTDYNAARAKLNKIRQHVPDAFIVKFVNGVRQ